MTQEANNTLVLNSNLAIGNAQSTLQVGTTPRKTGTDVMRQKYRALTDAEYLTLAAFKRQAAELYDLIDSFGFTRETSLAKTHIEEACFWTTKHLTA